MQATLVLAWLLFLMFSKQDSKLIGIHTVCLVTLEICVSEETKRQPLEKGKIWVGFNLPGEGRQLSMT